MSNGIRSPNSIFTKESKSKGTVVNYLGKRCKIFAYQPPYTPLLDCWPYGVSYDGLTSSVSGSLSEILEKTYPFARMIIVHKKYDKAGVEIAPRYYFINPNILNDSPKERRR